MRAREVVPDDRLPDIRPGDVVRLQHGQLRFIVEDVRRYDNFSSASLRPVERRTATGRPRPKKSRRTDQVVLLERPNGSQPMPEIPWDERELGRQLEMLLREDEREQQDARRAAARLARLEASGVEVVDEPTRTDADGQQTCGQLTQWRNGPLLRTRFTVDKAMRGSKLLRIVCKAEDWLDDLAAGTASYSDWDDTGDGAPTRGIARGNAQVAAISTRPYRWRGDVVQEVEHLLSDRSAASITTALGYTRPAQRDASRRWASTWHRAFTGSNVAAHSGYVRRGEGRHQPPTPHGYAPSAYP